MQLRACLSLLITRRGLAQQVRVRFAPSPTGKLHIGLIPPLKLLVRFEADSGPLFTTTFSLEKHNGLFILRIEDTDQERLKADSLPNILESLNWAGIEPDYGPHNHDRSDLGPLFQSQRLAIYQSHAQDLLTSRKAYYCFCDPTRLELLRKNAAKRQEKIGYDGKCRHLSQAQIDKFLDEKRPHVIRFKLHQEDAIDREVSFDDMAVGTHRSAPSKQESDFIILKSDGFPTYHFANVVDDHLMRITHVLRGQEWLLSTAKHILMYEAFGWTSPTFGHLPLICNPDGSKVSKRQNDADVLSYRTRGFFPETMLAYLTTIGGGCRSQIIEDEAFFQDVDRVRSNLVANFDESTISSRSIKLNPPLLDNINRRFLVSMSKSGTHQKVLVNDLRTLVKAKFPSINEHYLTENYLRSVLKWSLDRVNRICQLTEEPELSYLWTDATNLSRDKLQDGEEIAIPLIDALIAHLSQVGEDESKSNLAKVLEDVKKSKVTSTKNLWKLTRLLLIGDEKGPPVVELISLLGKNNCIFRLNLAKSIILNKKN